MAKEIEIPEGYEARIEGNKVIIELKESEDERIRKFLIDFIKLENGVNLSPDDAERCIAYLERQKKQTTKTDACGFPIRDKGESACSYLERCLAPDMRNIWYEACAEIKERQKEQKPAEWSDEDENKLYQVMEVLLADKTIALRDNPHCKALHRAYDELLDWLKSLHPQPKQEWSEEDEQYLLICENALAKYCRSEQWSYPIVSKWLEEHCKVLSQLHWKPSKKQMMALEWKINNTPVGAWQRKELESIYKELKKL